MAATFTSSAGTGASRSAEPERRPAVAVLPLTVLSGRPPSAGSVYSASSAVAGSAGRDLPASARPVSRARPARHRSFARAASSARAVPRPRERRPQGHRPVLSPRPAARRAAGPVSEPALVLLREHRFGRRPPRWQTGELLMRGRSSAAAPSPKTRTDIDSTIAANRKRKPGSMDASSALPGGLQAVDAKGNAVTTGRDRLRRRRIRPIRGYRNVSTAVRYKICGE